jgi:hypothetical protein
MHEVSPQGTPLCIAVCGFGCLVCLTDGPLVVADAASGGTVWEAGMVA